MLPLGCPWAASDLIGQGQERGQGQEIGTGQGQERGQGRDRDGTVGGKKEKREIKT